MPKYHDVEQGSEEWFKLRADKMTGSHATAIGNNGKGLDTYIHEMMAEYYSSADKEKFGNVHTDRGTELEPIARGMYELETGLSVKTTGFVEHDEYSGVSPDGLVEDDGGVEIKSISDSSYFKHLLYGEKEVSSDHVWQCQMNMFVTGRKWWDLVYYNPNFEKSLCIYRLYPDEVKFDKLRIGLESGREMIKRIKEQMK